MTNIAVFASGGGSNARAIIEYFLEHKNIRVSLIISNRRAAGVHEVAQKYGVPSVFVGKDQYEDQGYVLELLKDCQWIALAGFLKLIPSYLTKAFANRIVNIHPALLPKYGGHGMYGHYVHEAVFNNKETHTGLTIHLVDEEYDRGQIIKQGVCDIRNVDSPAEIAARVLKLEHYYYPRVLEAMIEGRDDLSYIDHTILTSM